jgi:hypothetical protein
LREIGDHPGAGQLAVQLEAEFTAPDVSPRGHLQLLADDLQIGVETPEQAAQEGEIAFVELRPGADRLAQTLHRRAQPQFVGHGIGHVGRRHVAVDLAAPGHARTTEGIFGKHHQLGRRALRELGLESADHTAEDLACLRLVAGVYLDGSAQREPRAVLEGILGTAVGGTRPVRETQFCGTHSPLGFLDAHDDEQLRNAHILLPGEA